MSFRDDYIRTLLFEKTERIPFMPGGPRESTLAAWHQQGLPEDKNYYQAALDELELPMIPVDIVSPGVAFSMMPIFEEKVLEHKNGHYIVQDWMGNITEISDRYDYTYIRSAKDFVTRRWHKFPVETRDDFERMKERYRIDTPGRFPADFEAYCKSVKESGALVALYFSGIFWQLREWCGFEPLCMMFIDQPDFVQEMIDFWHDWVLGLLRKIHEYMSIDSVIINEDMAYKAHSMISPEMTRKFILPVYKDWVAEFRRGGCPLVGVDSDGYIGELIPIWIEAGMNVCTPVEVAAHNDIVDFRRQFGRQMAYTGGIDKRAMAAGGSVLHAEMQRVIPPLLKEGGFIPSCDHGIPSDVSWKNFVQYCRILAEMCGWM